MAHGCVPCWVMTQQFTLTTESDSERGVRKRTIGSLSDVDAIQSQTWPCTSSREAEFVL
jgi:hypothetical protein